VKHIKQFYRFIKESYGENPSINWDIINTAKDLSLEYLDEGYKLCYRVYENELVSLAGGVGGRWRPSEIISKLVVEGNFSHDGDKFEWNEYDFYEPDPIDSKKLSYIFWFVRPNRLSDDLYLRMVNSYKLIISQLREIYPDEKINSKI
jgi:hypothetical protein